MQATLFQHVDVNKFEHHRVRGLSLTRPWEFAFLNQPVDQSRPPKRLENRSFRPPAHATFNQIILLHAAQSWDEGDREEIAGRTGLHVPPKHDTAHSYFYAACRLAGFVKSTSDPRFQRDEWRGQEIWFRGEYAWLIQNFVPLIERVECKGALGLWQIGHAQFVQLRDVYARSVECLNGN